MPKKSAEIVSCKNPNCKNRFTASGGKLYCCRKCGGEVYASKKGGAEYFEFNRERLTKQQISKKTGVPVFVINRRVKHLGCSVVDAANPELKIECKRCLYEFTPGWSNKSGFCSTSCANLYCDEAVGYSERHCIGCGSKYKPSARAQDYCTRNCRHVNHDRKYITSDDQYSRINGNWRRYFLRLVNQKGRKDLAADILLEIAELQGWRCALSGVEMQCYLKKGFKNPYNASIDRIEPGGPYSKENIRLTCAAVNKWRGDLGTDCFIEFCRAVADYNPRKEFV